VWEVIADGRHVVGFYDSPTGYSRAGGSGRGAAINRAWQLMGFRKASDKEMRELLKLVPKGWVPSEFANVGPTESTDLRRNPRSNPRTRALSAKQQRALEEMEFEIGEVNRLSDQYNKLFSSAIKKYGYGPGGQWSGWVSGVGKEHWPSGVKAQLRGLLAERGESEEKAIDAYKRTGARKPFWNTPIVKRLKKAGYYGLGE
jgi:hypothetical protein